MADDLDSVLSSVKADAATQNAAPPTAASEIAAPAAPVAPTASPELQSVLSEVKDMAHPAEVGTRSDADLDKEIADYQKQQRAYQTYQESQKPGEPDKAAQLLPWNLFHNIGNLQDPQAQAQLKATDEFIKDNAVTRIASAFGHAAFETAGTAATELLNPVTGGEYAALDSMNKVTIQRIGEDNPVANINMGILNLMSVVPSAVISAVGKLGEETGNKTLADIPQVMSDPNLIGSLPFMIYDAMPHVPEASIREFVTKPPLALPVLEAVNNGIITPSDPSIKVEAAQVTSAVAAAKAVRLEAQKGLVTSEVTPGLHDIVRKDNPELFNAYDALKSQLEAARQTIHDPEISGKIYDSKLADLTAQREQNLRFPTDLSKEELDAAIKGANVRDAQIASEIQDLGSRNKFIADSRTSARDKFLELDAQMRDIAPKINAAYEAAAPKAKDLAFAPTAPVPFGEPVKTVEGSQTFDIAADVKQKLASEGRIKEQAEAESKIIAARYETAAANGWAKGTAEELYKKHMAEIKIDRESKKKSRGDILLASKNSGKAIIRLFAKSDSSTLMHEMAHHWLDEMVGWEKEEGAPEDLKTHMQAVREWLGDKTGDLSGFTRGQHERFARGFERYLREGTAPSAELANAFAHFKDWLTNIYKSVAKLRVKLSPEVQSVFDHMLAVKPERIAIAEEEKGESNEKVSGAKATEGESETGNTSGSSGEARSDATGKEITTGIPQVDGTIGEGKTATGGGRERSAEGVSKETGTERSPVSKPVADLFDKAGNIRLELLTNDEETRAALRQIAAKTPLLDHDVIGDQEIAELAKSLGVKAKELNIEKLRQLAIEDNLPLAARVRASREMLLEADKQVRDLAGKVENGTSADLAAFTEAHNRFLMISETVSAITNQIGRALRAFQDISGDKGESATQLETLFQQEMATSSYSMKDLAKLVATKTESQSVAKMLQASIKPGFWDHFAEYRRCSILSGFVTHALWLTGTGINLLYKPIVLDTLGGIHNELGTALGREDTGSTITGGVEGLYRAITKALPNILSATGTAIRTGKTVLRPFEGELDTYLATGGIRKTLNINMDALRAATDSVFNVADYPELKALQDRITDAVKENNADKVAGLQLKLDEQSLTKKKEVAQKIAAQMQVRLKSWGELAGEIHDFGSSTMASALTVGKNILNPGEFLKDKPAFEARREGGVLPDIYVKGIPVAPIGSVMRGMSSRIYSSMHTFARETAANIETIQEARRMAVKEGLEGEDSTNRVNDLLSNPTKELMDKVNHIANKQTLMSNESEWAKAATRIRNAIDFHTGTKIGSVLMPVVGVPAEAVRQTVAESSPLGLLDRTERAALTGKMGAVEQERAQVKMAAGTALIGLGIYLGQKGLSTPSPSVNYNQEQERRDAGQQSGSIRAGDMMVSLQHVPVTGTLITLGADLSHIMVIYRGADISDRLKTAIASAVNNFLLHENALAEMADAVDAIRGKSDVASYLKNQAVSTLVPAFIKQGNDLFDPNLRESKSFMSSILSRIPEESETLAPKINALTGAPLPREPLHMHSADPNPIAQQLMSIHLYPTNPKPEINNVPLSTHQAAEYSSIKGHILHNGLQELMQGDDKQDFAEADVNDKRKMIQRVELHASQCAKSAMFNRYPELLKDANDRYEASCADETQ